MALPGACPNQDRALGALAVGLRVGVSPVLSLPTLTLPCGLVLTLSRLPSLPFLCPLLLLPLQFTKQGPRGSVGVPAENGGVLHLSTPFVFSLSSFQDLPCQGLFLSSTAVADIP